MTMYSMLLRRRSLTLAFATVCTFAASSVKAQVDLEILRRDGYGMVPINQPEPNELVAPATINGRKVTLILDTGFAGDGISLDTGYSGKMGATKSANLGGQSATGKKISINKSATGSVTLGNAQIQGVPLYFGSFQGLHTRRAFNSGSGLDSSGFLAADGFLGSGFLRTCSAVVDLHNRRLYLRPPGTGRRAALGPALEAVGLSGVPFVQVNGNCLVNAEVNGAPTTLIMDTGATLTAIDYRFAAQMKAAGYYAGFTFNDAAGAKAETHKTPVGSFKIGGVPVRAPDVQLGRLRFTDGSKIAGVLGMDILGQNWSIIDFGEHKLYFARAK